MRDRFIVTQTRSGNASPWFEGKCLLLLHASAWDQYNLADLGLQSDDLLGLDHGSRRDLRLGSHGHLAPGLGIGRIGDCTEQEPGDNLKGSQGLDVTNRIRTLVGGTFQGTSRPGPLVEGQRSVRF